MQKAKKYDWKDSNLALFGSDTEKQVKKESADSEPAWEGAGFDVSVQIWRINKFKVERWPKEDYGDFFNGDSYIILNTFKKEGEEDLQYDLHFWIGKYSTQDEYERAAYKTVELDTFLKEKPVQHREVQAHESTLFKSYFDVFTIMKGGCDTGFKHVLPADYEPRFFHVQIQSNKKITMTQVTLKKANFSEDDVFILETGVVVYQIIGRNCSYDEKFCVGQRSSAIVQRREELGRRTERRALWIDDTEIAQYFKDGEKKEKSPVEFGGNKILKVVPGAAPEIVGKNDSATRDLLDENDAFIIDTEEKVFVWIGTGASIDERKNGLSNASNYLNTTGYAYKQITVIAQGSETEEFNNAAF